MAPLHPFFCAIFALWVGACGSNPAEPVPASPDAQEDTSGTVDVVEPEDGTDETDAEPDLVRPDPDVETDLRDDPDPDADFDAEIEDVDADADEEVADAGPDTPSPVEDCINGIDDDGDGAIDELDADCEDVRACTIPPYGCEAGDWSCNVELGTGPNCSNGLDDDGDGTVDCEDPNCATDPPCRPLPCIAGECAGDEICEPYTGRCVPSESPAPSGGDIGSACETDTDCRTGGHLRGPPRGPACATEWPGGYCMGGCSFCESSWDGPQLPRRECPRGSVCLPGDQFSDQGSGACVQECQSDEDCRVDDEWTSYFCRRSFFVDGDWREYTNGYCAPPHCESRGCTGFVCGC